MLSQFRRRLLHRSFLSGYGDISGVFPSIAHFSAKKGDGSDPNFSAGISEPLRKSSRDSETDMLREVLGEKRANPKKVNFQKKGIREEQPLKQMKPGQLNVKMVQAAKAVASRAGPAEHEVMDDIMSKLDEVFAGVNHKKIKKKPLKKEQLQADFSDDLYQVTDELFKKQISKHKKGREEMDIVSVLTQDMDTDNFISQDLVQRKNDGSFRETFHFTSIENALTSKSDLGIFPSDLKESSDQCSSLWQLFEEKEIRRVTRCEPLNWFDQCIVWTEEGKLWHFPIDNEQGMNEEAEVDFTEHIFLDHHIESWCPTEGPIRHFMELVLVGLSKNPYLTVSEKKETLEWYNQYFMKHRSLLEEIDAYGSVQNPIAVEGTVH